MLHMVGNAILVHYFRGSGLHAHPTSSSWKTLLALISCPRLSPQRCPHSSLQWGAFKSSSSVAFTLPLGHRDPWQVPGGPVSGGQWFPSKNLPSLWCCLGSSDHSPLQKFLFSPCFFSKALGLTPPWSCIVSSPQNLKLQENKSQEKAGQGNPMDWSHTSSGRQLPRVTSLIMLSDASRVPCHSSCRRESPVDTGRPNHELGYSVAFIS